MRYVSVITIFMALFWSFFQEEDGIREVAVTGVQTCALPIWAQRRPQRTGGDHPAVADAAAAVDDDNRSGEGRVGEEGRSWGAPDYLKKKRNNKRYIISDITHTWFTSTPRSSSITC